MNDNVYELALQEFIRKLESRGANQLTLTIACAYGTEFLNEYLEKMSEINSE